MSERQLRRWLDQPLFLAVYRQARRRTVEGAIATLQQLMTSAVLALGRNLTCGRPGDEVKAALGIIDRALRGVELLDIEERVAELESHIKESRS